MMYRIITTIRKHIVPQEPLPGAGIPIRIDKPLDHRVVIPALEVVQPRLGVVVVSNLLKGTARRQCRWLRKIVPMEARKVLPLPASDRLALLYLLQHTHLVRRHLPLE